jgi:hypothetical protein
MSLKSKYPGMVEQAPNPSTWGLSQEDLKVQASLSYIARSCLKTWKKTWHRKQMTAYRFSSVSTFYTMNFPKNFPVTFPPSFCKHNSSVLGNEYRKHRPFITHWAHCFCSWSLHQWWVWMSVHRISVPLPFSTLHVHVVEGGVSQGQRTLFLLQFEVWELSKCLNIMDPHSPGCWEDVEGMLTSDR